MDKGNWKLNQDAHSKAVNKQQRQEGPRQRSSFVRPSSSPSPEGHRRTEISSNGTIPSSSKRLHKNNTFGAFSRNNHTSDAVPRSFKKKDGKVVEIISVSDGQGYN